MKRFILLITLLTFSVASYATSTPTNDKEKSPVTEGIRGDIASPSQDVIILGQDEGPAIASEEAIVTTSNNSSASQIGVLSTPKNIEALEASEIVLKKQRKNRVRGVKAAKTKTLKAKRQRQKRERAQKPSRKHDGGGILGILALVFGILGFLLAWFVWPLGILFALTAIILGAIGLGGENRGMSLVGLILGILTILIPVLIIAIIVAALA